MFRKQNSECRIEIAEAQIVFEFWNRTKEYARKQKERESAGQIVVIRPMSESSQYNMFRLPSKQNLPNDPTPDTDIATRRQPNLNSQELYGKGNE